MKSMVGWFVGALLLCGAAGAVAQTASAPAATSAPAGREGRLELESKEWDFGSVWYGDKPQGQLKLRNVGEGPLRLVRVHAACACTTGTLTKTVLQPGEEDLLTLGFDSTKTRDRFQQKQITIVTDEPARENTHIMVKGEARPLVEIDPPLLKGALLIGRVPHNVPKDLEYDLKVAYEQPLNLRVTGEENPWYSFELKEVEAGRRFKVLLRSKTPFQIGQMKTSVVLATGLASAPEYRIPLDGFALDRVMVIPDYIRISKARTQATDYNLMIIFHKDVPLEVQKISANFAGVESKGTKPIRPLSGNEDFRLIEVKLNLPKGADIPADGSGLLTVLTNVPGYEKLTVPVSNDRPPDDRFRNALLGDSAPPP